MDEGDGSTRMVGASLALPVGRKRLATKEEISPELRTQPIPIAVCRLDRFGSGCAAHLFDGIRATEIPISAPHALRGGRMVPGILGTERRLRSLHDYDVRGPAR